ncbi:MAG TPA: adenylate kinase [Chloroflexota bacterium]|nr:adenylate kinase [Chloroflexota bacterium]
MNIIVVGPPGVGKGTQSARLARSLGLRHVAAGDLLRAVREQDAPLGHTARQYMDAGQLVPDDVTMRIIEQRLAQPDAKDGVILDGFPRTVSQARALDASFARHNNRSAEDGIVLYLKASREVVLERMKGRWICQQCGRVYHILHVAPTEAGQCDVCGAPLFQRSDETPEIQARRYTVYEQDTLPMVDYYRQRGILAEINGERDVESVTRDILAASGQQPAASSRQLRPGHGPSRNETQENETIW